MKKLTPDQFKQLEMALVDAFPTLASLERMTYHALGQNLPAITGEAALTAAVFELIRWSDAHGVLVQLIQGARRENPGNILLKAFVEQVGLIPRQIGIPSRKGSLSGLPEGLHSARPYQVPSLPQQGVFGREDALAELVTLFALEDDPSNVRPVVLVGIGGVGKTTIATAFGRQNELSSYFPDGILWAELGPDTFANRNRPRELLNDWGRALGIDLRPERDETACRTRLTEILYERRVLLIVDDVWKAASGLFFRVDGPNCRMLFTTREEEVARILGPGRLLLVKALSPEASLAMLDVFVHEVVVGNRKAAEQLCEGLRFLPLALKLAGQFLALEAGVPSRMWRIVAQFTERKEAILELTQVERKLGLDENEEASIQAILALSVERLSREDQERFAKLGTLGEEPLTWTINAAASVWKSSLEEAETTIKNFINRGLVERQGYRYRAHDLLVACAQKVVEMISP